MNVMLRRLQLAGRFRQLLARPFTEKLAGEEASSAQLATLPQQPPQPQRKNSLSPFQQWCTAGGVERPYTGDKWHEREVGTYNCISCDSQLFR